MSWNEFFNEVFLDIIPGMAFNILIGLLIIFLGIALGFLVKRIVLGLLRVLKFEKLMEQLKLNHVFGKTSSTEILADFFEAFVILAFLVEGFTFMGFNVLAAGLSSLLVWAPKLLAALILLAVFYVIARYVEGRVQDSKIKSASSVSKYVFGAVLTIGAVVSLRQIGIDTTFLEQALLIVIFGFALAFALAVGISMGLGLKGEAKDLLKKGAKPKKKKR